MAEHLNYDELVESYYRNLHTTLRNFTPGPEFLESWVHDENHNRSIVGLFEAAEDGGIEELELEVGPQLADALDREWIKSNLSGYGEFQLTPKDDGLRLNLAFKGKQAPLKVHEAYRDALEMALKQLRFQGAMPSANTAAGETLIQVTQNGMTLGLVLDQKSLIVQAKHAGATGLNLPLIDQLCRLLFNTPIQEAAEHSVIRLEKVLRSEKMKPPVPGLVTPENADPMFKPMTQIIRAAFQEYLKVKHAEPQWNDWDTQESVPWQALSPEEKLAKVKAGISQICKELDLPYGCMEIIGTKSGGRVVLSGQGFGSDPIFGHHLMTIERELKKRVEPKIELILESLEDRNKRETRTHRETTFK